MLSSIGDPAWLSAISRALTDTGNLPTVRGV